MVPLKQVLINGKGPNLMLTTRHTISLAASLLLALITYAIAVSFDNKTWAVVCLITIAATLYCYFAWLPVKQFFERRKAKHL